MREAEYRFTSGVFVFWLFSLSGCATPRLDRLPLSADTSAGGSRVSQAASSSDDRNSESWTGRPTVELLPVELLSDPAPEISPAQPAGPASSHISDDGMCESVSWEIDKAWFLSDFRDDLASLVTRQNMAVLLAAGGASYAFHEQLDDDVAENTTRHANRWGRAQNFFGGIGNPIHHLAAVSGLYAYSLYSEDVETNELSKTLFSAVAITGISSTLLKLAANTTRPNGDSGGWPSGHASSSMAVAAVLDEYYGHSVGFPAYLLAGLVAWERIDDREHDLSDVVFGAALGYVIGRSVAEQHQFRIGRLNLQPFVDPETGTSGVALERRY